MRTFQPTLPFEVSSRALLSSMLTLQDNPREVCSVSSAFHLIRAAWFMHDKILPDTRMTPRGVDYHVNVEALLVINNMYNK